MRRHQLLAEADAAAQYQRTDQAGDARIDMHHRAAREVDGAPLERQARVGLHRSQRLLGRLLGGACSGLGNLLGGVGGARTAPVPDHVGDREVDEGHPEGDEEHRAENFMRSAKAPTIRAGVMQANVIWKPM